MRSLFFITYFIYVILRSKKSLHMLQQNFYNNSNRYIKWIFNNLEKSILTIDWLFLILVVLGLLGVNVELLFFLFYLGLTLHYYTSDCFNLYLYFTLNLQWKLFLINI